LASWGDRELAVERTAEGRSGAGTLRRRDVAPIQRHELIEIREGEVARARPLGRQGDDGQLEPIDQSKAESWIPAGGQSRRRTEGAVAPNQRLVAAMAGAIGLETEALSRREATRNWSAGAGLGYRA
jgi:hypothetical protein